MLGGRLHDFREHPETLSAEEYARRVEAGELADTVLSFQLAQGFTLKKVLPSFLEDPRSRDFGTLLEWLNPDYRPRARKTQSIRVSSVQYRMRKVRDFKGFAQQIQYFVDVAAGYGSDFVLFPELLTAQCMSYIDVKTPIEAIRRLTELTEDVDRLFVDLAREHQVAIIGGTHPIRYEDRIENVASLYLPDGVLSTASPSSTSPPTRPATGESGAAPPSASSRPPRPRVGILICDHVEFPEAARYLADQGAEVIFVPFCTDDRQSYLRVRYCAQARAVENQVYLALAGTIGNLPDVENMDIQYAQSAVLSPSDFPFARDGILVEAPINTETVITTDLDFEALEEAINIGTVRPRRDRRPDLFRFLTTVSEDTED